VGVDPNIHPHWAAETKQIAAGLHLLDYYQILGVGHDAQLPDIKQRYHALQREYHPDTFFQSPDEELQTAVFHIAKRVAEAYVVLRDTEKRTKYTRDILGEDRATKLRYTDEAEAEKRREKEEELGKTAQGRKLVQKALISMKRGDLGGAQRDLQTAMLFEKDNELIKEKLAEISEKLAAGKKK